MRDQHTLEVGNSTILLTDHEFSDGHTNGYLTYYDERYRPCFPLTSEIIVTFLVRNLQDPRRSAAWNGGFVVGWTEALIENGQQTFWSTLPGESVTVFQEA